jgi:hypothetical protein
LVAPFSVVDSHLHCGTLMPYQKGATIPLASTPNSLSPPPKSGQANSAKLTPAREVGGSL